MFVLKFLESKNKKHYVLEKEIGLTRGIIAQWKTGRSKAGVDALVKIADYYNVPLDYLIGRTEPPEVELPMALIERWNQLDELQQARVTAYMDGLIAADMSESKSRKA